MNSGKNDTSSAQTLWVLTEVYYPEEISTGYYLTEIAEGLAIDRKVRVITGQPKHMSRGIRAPKTDTRNGVDIERVWSTTFDKNSLIPRLINMATIGVSMLFKALVRLKKGDSVLVVTAPPSLPLTATLAALIKGAETTVLVQDSYPEILVAVGSTKPGSLVARSIDIANRFVFKYARRIIVMGRDMQEMFAKKAAGLDVPIEVIPNWADLESIQPTPHSDNTLLRELGLSDKFVLLCAGNLGPAIDLGTIVDAAELLRPNNGVHFLFIGAGAKTGWLRDQINERSLTNVTLLDYMPRSEQNIFLNACDVGLVALIPGMRGTAMPSRTYNLMAAGKPIIAICEQGSELDLVVNEDKIGMVICPGDAKGLAAAISSLRLSEDRLAQLGQNARIAAKEKYSPGAAIGHYRRALR